MRARYWKTATEPLNAGTFLFVKKLTLLSLPYLTLSTDAQCTSWKYQ